VASRSQPLRRLVAFEKVALAPGEARTVTFQVAARELAFHDEDGREILEPGRFELFAGTDATADLTAGFDLAP
jgi:beta-glucosidase